MCPSEMDRLENFVGDLYLLLGAQMNNAGVKLGEDLPVGYRITGESGRDIVPSPFVMESISGCVQRVFESWEQSKKQPDWQVLRSWFESMDAEQEERITTLLSVVMMTGLRLSIASGETSMVLRMLESIFPAKEPKDTAQSISSKSKTESGNGTSSAPPRRGGKGSSRSRSAKSTRPTGRKTTSRSVESQATTSGSVKNYKKQTKKRPKSGGIETVKDV